MGTIGVLGSDNLPDGKCPPNDQYIPQAHLQDLSRCYERQMHRSGMPLNRLKTV